MSNWIKIRVDLDTDPRVFTMAKMLAPNAALYVLTAGARDLFGAVTEGVTRNAMRDVTLAALSRVWAKANTHTTNGVFTNATLDYLDSLAQLPGFGEAMASVGWAIFDPTAHTVSLPNFEEHNAPDKNGQRSKTAGALRQQKLREKRRQEAANSPSPQEPNKDKSNADGDVTRDVTPSISDSVSISDSGTPSEGTQTPTERSADTLVRPVPVTAPPLHIELEQFKKRINALRPAWVKLPAWSHEDETALLQALPNLRALEDRDWLLLKLYLSAANSSSAQAQQAKDRPQATSKRHLLLAELASYLDRATTHWKQSGCPKLAPAQERSAGIPSGASQHALPVPAPAPATALTNSFGEAASPPTDAFSALLTDLNRQRPKAETPPIPAPVPVPAAA